MKRVKIGIIGTGVGIRTHYKGFKSIEAAEIYAISGSSFARSKEFAEKYNIPIACADYKELCDLEELDLICITAPNKFHSEMVKYAIGKHKHIICEKPLVNTAEEAKELNLLAKNHDKLLFVDHQLRFNPYITAIKNIIHDGLLGNIYSVKLNQQGSGFADENAKWCWSFDGAEGGGVRLAMASHFTDLLQYWFGNRPVLGVAGYLNPVTKVRKDLSGKLRTVDASTVCTAIINFKDELTAQYFINAGSYMGSRFDISIFGDKGELTFSLQDKLALYTRDKVGIKQQIEVENVYPDEKENKASIFSGSFRYLAPLVVEAILSGNYEKLKKAASFDDAIYNLVILDAIQKSANENTAFILNKEKNSYV